jgi:pilus assembly protein CpaC
VLDVGSPIQRVSLTSPDVADALVTTQKQLLVNGKAPGAISMYVWDREGTLRRYDLIVQRDISRLSEQLTMLFPGESITAHSSGKNIVLSGQVTSKDAVDRIVNVTAGYTDKREEVVSLLQVAPAPTDQVLLHVRFAEVSRSALTEVGAFALHQRHRHSQHNRPGHHATVSHRRRSTRCSGRRTAETSARM